MADTGSDEKSEEQPQRSPEEIQSDIEATRARLVDNLEKLKAETKPKVLLGRAQAKVTAVFVDEQTGQVRRERVAAVAGVVVTLVVLRRMRKARVRRRELEKLRAVVWVPVPRTAVSPELARVARDAKEIAPGPAVEVITAADLEAGRVPLAIESGD